MFNDCERWEMTDITKCTGEGCPRKHDCYRFVAKAGDYQSWFMQHPLQKDGTCDEFYPMNSKSRLKRIDAQQS